MFIQFFSSILTMKEKKSKAGFFKNKNMTRVVLDIETVGVNFDKLDEKSQEYLLKFAEGEEEIRETKEKMALYPLTGEVVVVGMLNPDTGKGKMFYQLIVNL